MYLLLVSWYMGGHLGVRWLDEWMVVLWMLCFYDWCRIENVYTLGERHMTNSGMRKASENNYEINSLIRLNMF